MPPSEKAQAGQRLSQPLRQSIRLPPFPPRRAPARVPGSDARLAPFHSWILLDTETNGLWPPVHIIELAAQRFDGLVPIGDPFRVFIDHAIEIPSAATAVHGYTAAYIKARGISPREAYAQFREYAGDRPIASHYLLLDWDRALVPELERLGEPPIGRRGFCSWYLTGRALPELPSHHLDYLRTAYNLKGEGAHTALGDVESLVDLLVRVVFPRLGRLGCASIEDIAEFSQIKEPLEPARVVREILFENERKNLPGPAV